MIYVGITQVSIIPHDPRSIKVGIDIVLENAWNFSWTIVFQKKNDLDHSEKWTFFSFFLKNDKIERFKIVRTNIKKLWFFILKNVQKIFKKRLVFFYWTNDFIARMILLTSEKTTKIRRKINDNFKNERNTFFERWKKN